jgi:hypothetical protein
MFVDIVNAAHAKASSRNVNYLSPSGTLYTDATKKRATVLLTDDELFM